MTQAARIPIPANSRVDSRQVQQRACDLSTWSTACSRTCLGSWEWSTSLCTGVTREPIFATQILQQFDLIQFRVDARFCGACKLLFYISVHARLFSLKQALLPLRNCTIQGSVHSCKVLFIQVEVFTCPSLRELRGPGD